MVLVRETTAEEWRVMRRIRLEALRDAPDAFGSTYAEEAASDEAAWQRSMSSGVTFFAYLSKINGTDPVGLVAAFQEKPGRVELVSLWVRPQARGQGVGEALVAAVIGWAEARIVTSVHLWVIEINKHAWVLYERCGFALTGERQPLPSKPDLTEIGMIRPL